MYVIPLADDPFIWDGSLFIHQGEPGRIHPYIFEKLKVFLEARLLHRFHPKV
jgi:hypothetical protein